MKWHVYRAARLTIIFPLLVLIGGLFWCIYFTDSPIVKVAVLVVIIAIFVLTRERIAAIWRQILVLEDHRLIYFDGQTRHEIRFADIKKIRVGRWTGNFRVRQNEGHSLALLPQSDEKIECWDLSDFSLRVVLQLVCELARHADWPAIEVQQTEFQNLHKELFSAVRGLGTLSPIDLGDVDEDSLSFYEKEFHKRERRYLFTPKR